MKVNQVSRKLLKPYTPTPQNLKNYKISSIDELMPSMNLGILLFYPSKVSKRKEIISHLEESLAKVLVQFYPLAGRYTKRDRSVDCSDEGAEFIEAEAVDVELTNVVGKTTTLEQLNDLLPRQFYQVDEAASYPLLSIQITQLINYGGLVIGVSISHRVFDASSVGTFIAAWSTACNHGPCNGKVEIFPNFDSPSLFPCKSQHFGLDPEPPFRPEDYHNKVVAKRLSFKKEAITSLRSKLRPNDKKVAVSRVRMASALIAKVMIGVDRAKYGKSRACLILLPVDMRGRTIPPLPKHSCGNLSTMSVVRCMATTETNEDIGIQELVNLIGDAIEKTIADCAGILSDQPRNGGDDDQKNMTKELASGEVNVLVFTDWSKFGYYEADFDWGKPVWASIGRLPYPNITVLMDNKEGDGIEAWVHLHHDDVPYFDQDEVVKLFTNKE